MVTEFYTCDAHTGELESKVDLGNVSWSLTVNDSSLSTTRDRKVGQDEVQSVDVPWDAIPGDTVKEKTNAIDPGRKAIAAFNVTDNDILQGSLGTPYLWGVINAHTPDKRTGTSIVLSSVYDVLANRYAIKEGQFKSPRSKTTLSYSGMTWRGIASEVGWVCTDQKPGGLLPVDWQYRGEKHKHVGTENRNTHVRNYNAWNVQNISGKDIFDKLAGVSDGVDMQWQPYLADQHHVRLRFVAGTDEEQYLPQSNNEEWVFSSYNHGGNLDDLQVDYGSPVSRWYGTGAGEDAETLTYMAQDLSFVNGSKNYMIYENTISDTNADKINLLKGKVDGKLKAWKRPIMQFTATYNQDDPNTPQLGTVHPGEAAVIMLRDFPSLPDGDYHTRIMELSGDSSPNIKIVFDVMQVPNI